MNASTLVALALAVAGFAGTSTGEALAQERPLGHESAVGPGPGAGAHGPGGMNQGRPAQGPVHPGGPGAAPPAMGGRPTVEPGPRHGPQGQTFGPRPMAPPSGPGHGPQQGRAFGQRPMAPPAAPAMRPNNGPAGVQNFGAGRARDTAPHVAPRGPIDHAPLARGAIPAPYRGNIHRFVDRDARVWRGGRWHHSHHDGRFGWWWVVGGLWYYYPQPVYPYPDPFVPGTVYGPGGSGPYWYYCESAGQYYPYVTYCPEGWVAVVPDQ